MGCHALLQGIFTTQGSNVGLAHCRKTLYHLSHYKHQFGQNSSSLFFWVLLAEYRRIDAFELWYWRRLLRVPWTARRSKQFILKETSPGCSLEGLMLRLKLQYFGHLVQRVDSLEKILMLGGIGAGGEEDNRWWDGWMASPTRWTWVWVNSGSWWWTGRPGMLWFMGLQRVRHDWATELNWTELSSITISIFTWTLFPFFFAAPVLLNLFSIPYRIGLWHGWEIWLIHLRGHDLWLSC